MNEYVLNGLELAKSDNKTNNFYYSFKRLSDIFFCIFGFSMLLIAIIFVKVGYILCGDFKSIFYTQQRIGKDGKLFKLYKFRTMCNNADKVLEDLLANDPIIREEYRINKKLKKDPRVNRVGKIIRKLSIDEMPQFINILKGDMHLIGNRPYLPREIKDMGSYYKEIIKTKPGLTGYWQVNGRSNTTFLKRLQLESEYSNIANIWLDTRILFKSLATVLSCKGAE